MKTLLHPKAEEFLDSLESPQRAKAFHVIELLQEYGSDLRMPHSRKVGDKLFELRVLGVKNVRIFYTYHKRSAVLLHGFIKKTQETPRREIETAQQRRKRL